MVAAKDYLTRIKTIINPCGSFDGKKLQLKVSYNTIKDARVQLASIRQVQKELRQIKKEVNQLIKGIRATYTSRRAKVQSSSVLSSLFKIKGAGHMRSMQQQGLTRQQNADIEPYKGVVMAVDQILMHLDALKLQIDSWIAENK